MTPPEWGVCAESDCTRPWLARGLCGMHYGRALRGTMPMPPTLRALGLSKPGVNKPACRVHWCDKPVRAMGFCNTHYQRDARGADMNQPIRVVPSYSPECAARACDRPQAVRGYCSGHYARYREGRPVEGPLNTVAPGRSCKAEGCDRPHAAKGYCNLHRARELKGAPVDAPIRQGLTDVCDFAAAHTRAKALWGPASQYPCIECGEQARDWAYDGTDSTELLGEGTKGGSLMRYSLYPEFYMPMCSKCHHRRDKRRAAAELREYREFKHRTGLTLADIEPLLTKLLDAETLDIESAA